VKGDSLKRSAITPGKLTPAHSAGQTKYSLPEDFFSFVNLGCHFIRGKVVIAIALPENNRYKTLVNIIQYYFVRNRLKLKIYLVNENGRITTVCLKGEKNEKAGSNDNAHPAIATLYGKSSEHAMVRPS
jgi:hypothetical protein